MCLVISLFCLFYFHVKSLNFIFYVFVKSIVHQSYDQSIGSIYTSVDLKGNQLNWVGELFNSRNNKNLWWKNKPKKSSSVNQQSLTFDTNLCSALYSCAICMGFTMARPQLANVNAHIDHPHIFNLVLRNYSHYLKISRTQTDPKCKQNPP